MWHFQYSNLLPLFRCFVWHFQPCARALNHLPSFFFFFFFSSLFRCAVNRNHGSQSRSQRSPLHGNHYHRRYLQRRRRSRSRLSNQHRYTHSPPLFSFTQSLLSQTLPKINPRFPFLLDSFSPWLNVRNFLFRDLILSLLLFTFRSICCQPCI